MRISDWSSDVCSSDLGDQFYAYPPRPRFCRRQRGNARFASGLSAMGRRRPARYRHAGRCVQFQDHRLQSATALAREAMLLRSASYRPSVALRRTALQETPFSILQAPIRYPLEIDNRYLPTLSEIVKASGM